MVSCQFSSWKETSVGLLWSTLFADFQTIKYLVLFFPRDSQLYYVVRQPASPMSLLTLPTNEEIGVTYRHLTTQGSIITLKLTA